MCASVILLTVKSPSKESFVALFLKKDGIYCLAVEYVSMTGNKGRKEELQGERLLRLQKLA